MRVAFRSFIPLPFPSEERATPNSSVDGEGREGMERGREGRSSECCGDDERDGEEDGRQIYFVRDEGCLST